MTDEQDRTASDLMFTGNPFVGSTDEDPLDVGSLDASGDLGGDMPTAVPRQVESLPVESLSLESLPEQVYGQVPAPSDSVWTAIQEQLEREGLIH